MKKYYTPPELAKQDWFPYKSTLTIYKLIESGELDAICIDKSKRTSFKIPKYAVDFYLWKRFGSSLSELGIAKEDIIKFLTNKDN
jgi:hypothetical protein